MTKIKLFSYRSHIFTFNHVFIGVDLVGNIFWWVGYYYPMENKSINHFFNCGNNGIIEERSEHAATIHPYHKGYMARYGITTRNEIHNTAHAFLGRL